MTNKPEQNDKQQNSVGIFDVMKSVLSAMIGVQNDENRERDFNHGKASDYIIVGIIFVIIFIITIMTIVSTVID